MSSSDDYIYLFLAVFCIFCAALAAGLTIGLVSMDRNVLRLLSINGTDKEREQVTRVLPLLKDRHWLLVTLFLFNATANEALPVFLEKLIPGYAAIVLSALLVLIFGEIIPSSVFSGKRQLELASKLSWLVRILLVLLFFIAKPIALFLDHWIGRHEDDVVPFNAKDLYTLLSLSAAGDPEESMPSTSPRSPPNKSIEFKDHTDQTQSQSDSMVLNILREVNSGQTTNGNACKDADLTIEDVEDQTASIGNVQPNHDEFLSVSVNSRSHRAPSFLGCTDGELILLNMNSVMIAQGAIICSKKTVEDILIPREKYFSVHADDEVSVDLLEKIGNSGFSRVIVTSGRNSVLGDDIMGYLVVKDIMKEMRSLLPILCKTETDNARPPVRYVSQLRLYPVHFFRPSCIVIDALQVLKCGESRIAAVTANGQRNNSVLLGFFSMEDIVEAILQSQIEDEKDAAKSFIAENRGSSAFGSMFGLF